ncbi:MAG TPA: hypothetical protein VFC36_09035 [Paludibacter sp.]|nr:hypothetical protein [Paludibacter sp.]
MNNYQKARLSSNKQIVIEAETDAAVVAVIPTFVRGIEQLKVINSEIDDLSAIQSQDLTGITDDKNDVQQEVIDYLLEFSGAIHSYAGQQGNKSLQALVNFKPTKVVHLDQHEIINAATTVFNEARKVSSSELTNEGITPDEITRFDDVLTRLKGYSNTRHTAGIDQMDITRRIAKLFAQATDIKKNTLDRLAPQYQRKAPEFFNKYKAASNVLYRRATKKTDTTTTEAKA